MRIITLSDPGDFISTPYEELYDGYVNEQASHADNVYSYMDLTNENAVCVLNNYCLYATCYHLGTIDQTIDCSRSNGRYGKDLAFYFQPTVTRERFTVNLAYVGETVLCGQMVAGLASEYATTLYGVEIGINDYSIIDADSFGHTYLSQGNWTKKVIANLNVANSDIDLLFRNIIDNRGTPAVFDYNEYNYALNGATAHNSDNGFRSLLVYGFTVDFYITYRGPNYSTATHEVQGLI